MASLPPSSNPPKRRPALRGVIQMDTANGKLRARAWPRKRNKPKTKEQAALENNFRLAQICTKYFEPRLYADAINAVAGTPLLPRDIMTMQLFNRLVMFKLDDGRELWPMTARFDVSRALDILASNQGSMLIRGDDFWEGWTSPDSDQMQSWLSVLGGDPGQVLTRDGSGWSPQWPFSGARNIASATSPNSESANSTVYTDLVVPGPIVEIETDTTALVTMTAMCVRASGTPGFTAFIAPQVSLASTIPASDASSAQASATQTGFNIPMARTFLMTGLTPGLNRFTMKYRSDGGGYWNWYNRDLTVIAL